MAILSHTVLREFSYQIFQNAGAIEDDARIVSEHLVSNSFISFTPLVTFL